MFNLKNKNIKVEKEMAGYGVGENYKSLIVFDCESDGLYGECFAFGAVALKLYPDNKVTIAETICIKSEEGEKNISSNWVKENVLPYLLNLETVPNNLELRQKFWAFYSKYKNDEKYIGTYSDVNFPVETNFLAQVAKDDLEKRAFNMPYPLYDISSIHNDTNSDREDFYIQKNAYYIVQDVAIRKPKKHNPLWDSICSAYFLLNY